MSVPLAVASRDPNGSMLDAFHTLRDTPDMDSQERDSALAVLARGTNGAYAWFALSQLKALPEAVQTSLCKSVARSRDGFIILWTLEVSDLSAPDRQVLKEMLVTINLPFFAQRALDEVPDLSDLQRVRLTNIAAGRDPDHEP